MSPDDVREALREQLPSIFECEPRDGWLAVVITPLQMPDGSLIAVWLEERGDCLKATDCGDAMFAVRLAAPDGEMTPGLRRLATRAAAIHGVELENSEVVAQVNGERSLAATVMAVAQASLRVSCLVYACRDPNERDLFWELGELLRDAGAQFERSVSCTGASGREWPVSYAVKCGDSTALIIILTGGTSGQSKAVADHTVAVIDDLRPAAAGSSKFVVLFDDVEADWPDDAIERLTATAEAVPWSERADLIRTLAREPAAVG